LTHRWREPDSNHRSRSGERSLGCCRREMLEAEFADLGEQALKNIARPQRIYCVGLSPSTNQAIVAPAPLPLLDKPSIAVLPFANMSGDPEQEYFADGMVEEIIIALSRIRWLFVIARNSSFTYKGQAVDVKQVGRELGVRSVLESKVRIGGNAPRSSIAPGPTHSLRRAAAAADRRVSVSLPADRLGPRSMRRPHPRSWLAVSFIAIRMSACDSTSLCTTAGRCVISHGMKPRDEVALPRPRRRNLRAAACSAAPLVVLPAHDQGSGDPAQSAGR